jgi:serine/alanine adding enzyme
MIRPMSTHPSLDVSIHTHTLASVTAHKTALTEFVFSNKPAALSLHPGWLEVLQSSLGYEVYALEAVSGRQTCGYLPLAYVSSMLFGRFLVSLPYLNSNGLMAASADVKSLLISRAVELADELDVKHLELRHETPIEHPQLTVTMTSKVHMRMPLPATFDQYWKGLDPKVRNQVRKGEKNSFGVNWGGTELLDPFYDVFSKNMRDLGTPPYSPELFRSILTTFPNDAEICVLTDAGSPIACGLLLHGPGVTEVPSASSLREYNASCANMLMYRHLIERAIHRKQTVFDFGRSTTDGPTFKFKKQWGSVPHPASWQYHVRRGDFSEVRPENPRYRRMIQLWQKLPVPITRVIGPSIVRGIP